MQSQQQAKESSEIYESGRQTCQDNSEVFENNGSDTSDSESVQRVSYRPIRRKKVISSAKQ